MVSEREGNPRPTWLFRYLSLLSASTSFLCYSSWWKPGLYHTKNPRRVKLFVAALTLQGDECWRNTRAWRDAIVLCDRAAVTLDLMRSGHDQHDGNQSIMASLK